MINKEIEQKLWINYFNNKNIINRNKLIEYYISYVRYIASKFKSNLKIDMRLEHEDLVQYGVFGLIKAIEKFDRNKKVLFRTYAYIVILGNIKDEIRKISWIPASVFRAGKKGKKLVSDEALKFKPSDINVENIIIKSDYKDKVKELIELLPEREKKIVIHYYYEGLSQMEVAEVLNLSGTRINQLLKIIIDFFKGQMKFKFDIMEV